jgi:diguanylate cyclase (GGDEF)-like protein
VTRGRRVLAVVAGGPAGELLVKLIGELDCEVRTVPAATDAVRLAEEEWDLVVVDAELASDDGFRSIRNLRARVGSGVPILLSTALGDLDARRRGIEHGADDFLVTPPTALEVEVRLTQAFRLRELGRELDAARDALALSALGDPTTGLYSPRALSDRLLAEYARARRYKRPLCVVALAIGRGGRGAEASGDRLLGAVGQGVRAALRQTDFLARSGQMELAVVAPETAMTDGHLMVARLQAQLAHLGLAREAGFGLASTEDRMVASADDLLDAARRAIRPPSR